MIDIRQTALVESDYIEPFEDRIDILFHELELAAKWQCPSLLLAIYSSEFVHGDAEVALENRLLGLGQKAHHIIVKSQDDADIPLLISELPDLKNGVVFVEGLRWGGGQAGYEAYRSLNKHREFFIENQIRVVFWLTETEAIHLAHFAPDYWTFRHRVIEFVDSPRTEQISSLVPESACQSMDDVAGSAEDLDAKITLRAALLTDLPEGDESTAARANLLLTLGILHWRRGDYDQAAQFLNTALELAAKLQDNHFEALCFNATALVETALGKMEAAIRSYQHALELAPSQVSPWNNMGNLHYKLGQYEEALTAFQKAVEQTPSDRISWGGLANSYYKLGRHEDAIFAFQKNLELNPTDAHSWSALAEMYAAEGQPDEALAAYQKALEIDPGNARLLNEIGSLHYNAAAYEEAAHAYQRAIELDQSCEPSYNNLASILILSGNHAEAIPLLQKGIELQSEPAQAAILWDRLGDAYRKLNDYENAMAAYRKADELELGTASPQTTQATLPEEAEIAAPLPVAGPAEVQPEPIPAPLPIPGPAEAQPEPVAASPVDDVQESPASAETVPVVELVPANGELVDNSGTLENESEVDFAKWLEGLAARLPVSPAPDETDAAEIVPQAVEGSPEAEASQEVEGTLEIEELQEAEAPQEIEVLQEAEVSQEIEGSKETEDPQEIEGSRDFEEYLRTLPSLSEVNGPAETEAASQDCAAAEAISESDQAEISLASLGDPASTFIEPAAEDPELEDTQPVKTSPRHSVSPLPPAERLNVEKEAVTVTEKADFDAKSAQIWNELGNIYYNIVAYDEAINALNKAIELDHSYGWTYNNLASIYIHKGSYAEAIPLLQRGIPLMRESKDKALLWNRLGDAYRRMDQHDKAAAAYKKAVELDPDNVSLLTRARFSLLGNCRA